MSQQTFYYVSKTHVQSVKRLYKLVFQLHKSLPVELREIGNSYVRNEFKLHKAATPDQAKTFLTEWANYAQTLMKQLKPNAGPKRIGLNLEDKIENFNEGQITQLYELFQETKKAPSPNNATKNTKQ